MRANGRPRRRRGKGQATIEFAYCLPLYLLIFVASIDAALWAIETSACVSAAEVAGRLAASVDVGSVGIIDPNAAELTPRASVIKARVADHLQSALFGTTIVQGPDGGGCPADPVAEGSPRTVVVCFIDGPACLIIPSPPPGVPVVASTPCSPWVEVKIVGYLASLVPPAFGLGWTWGQIPIDVGVMTHAQRFNP